MTPPVALSPRAAYARVAFDARVVAADPAELAEVAYDALLAGLADTRRALAAGRLAGRSAGLTRALTALNLLEAGLDHAAGGAVAASLGQWYRTLRRAILDRGLATDPGAFDPLIADARDLADAWRQARTGRTAERG